MPSESWKNTGISTQHAQQLLKVHPDWSAQQSTQHAQQLPEVRSDWSTQQSTQHAQQLPEVHSDWSTQQSTQHAQQLPEVRSDWSTQHAQQSTQRAQYNRETLKHTDQSALPFKVVREVSLSGNKTYKTGNILFIEVKIGKRQLSGSAGPKLGSDVAPEALSRFIAVEQNVTYSMYGRRYID